MSPLVASSTCLLYCNMQVLCHLWSVTFQSTLFSQVQMWNSVNSKNTYLLSDRLTRAAGQKYKTDIRSLFQEISALENPNPTSDSLSSTFPLKTDNWGCSKAEHYVIWDGQYRCVPYFHLPCFVTLFTWVLGTTWAHVFTSSGFIYKATPISHPVSPLPLIWTQTGLDLFHTWSKNAYYGSATGTTNPDWGGLLRNLHVLEKFHHSGSMETQMRNTSQQIHPVTEALQPFAVKRQAFSFLNFVSASFQHLPVAVAWPCIGVLSNK